MDGEERPSDPAGGALTVGALWHDIAGRRLDNELLDWAPDVFVFTNVVLDRSEAYRFVVSPPSLEARVARGGWVRGRGFAEFA